MAESLLFCLRKVHFCSWMIIWTSSSSPCLPLVLLPVQQDPQKPPSVTFIFALCAAFKPGGVKGWIYDVWFGKSIFVPSNWLSCNHACYEWGVLYIEQCININIKPRRLVWSLITTKWHWKSFWHWRHSDMVIRGGWAGPACPEGSISLEVLEASMPTVCRVCQGQLLLLSWSVPASQLMLTLKSLVLTQKSCGIDPIWEGCGEF